MLHCLKKTRHQPNNGSTNCLELSSNSQHGLKELCSFEPDQFILSLFMFFKSRTNYPELKEQLKELRKHLIESTNEMAPLKVWQMQGEYIKY